MGNTADELVDFAAARQAMIDSQLRTSGVNADWVLARMAAVPREAFVPPELRAAAYTDRAIRVDAHASLASPLFYGMLLQEARPVAGDRALIVSAAPGYLSALLEPLVAEIATLAPAEARNGAGDGAKGRFTLLLIDGAAEHVPAALAAALAPGGRAVGGIVVNAVQRLAYGRPAGDALVFQPLMEMGIPRLVDLDKPKEWRF